MSHRKPFAFQHPRRPFSGTRERSATSDIMKFDTRHISVEHLYSALLPYGSNGPCMESMSDIVF